VEALREGESLPLGGGRRKAVLAALLLHANEPVRAERLIDEIWGDDAPSQNTVHVHVSQLRKQLGDALRHDPSGYVLQVDDGALDLQRFERLLSQARATSDQGQAATLLDDALALWHGPALADAELGGSAAAEPARLEELRLGAIETRIDAVLAIGRHAELVSQLEALVAEHPLRERLRAQLMLALYRSGRQSEALEVYRDASRMLRDELGIEPGIELQRLERAILEHASELDATVPSAREPVRLPAAPSPLVGRERELEEIVALVRSDDVRLLTFTGPGGIGKTRLALEAAHRLAGESGGAVFVALAGVTDATLIASAIAQALDVRVRADDSAEEVVVEFLGPRRLLLVVDNMEQLLDGAPLLSRLLTAAPGLKVLVTSRSVLRLTGEHEVVVPPLAAAEELFRARAGQLATTEANDVAISEICTRLEGLPLAIELAAARVGLLPPPALLARLESRLDILTAGTRDAPERQRTMRGAIDWSYRLLDPGEQVLFARLGVFVGGADLDAVESVGEEVATLDALASLVDKSLLRQHGAERPRFAMLEVLREFALEQLRATGEEEALRSRHAQHFRALVDEAEVPLSGPEQGQWLDRLETDHANLRAAIAYAQTSRDGATAVDLAAGMRRFWYVHGHAEEGLRVLESVLAEAPDAPPLARSKALNGAGMLASARGDYAAARRFLEESLAVAEQLGDSQRMGVASSNLGNLALYEERWDEARSRYERALELYRGVSPRDAAITLENLGLVAAAAGDLDTAETLLEEAIALSVLHEAPREVASARRDLAWVLLAGGDLERTRELLVSAWATFGELTDRANAADCLEAFAALALAEGRLEEAARLLGAAEAIRDAIGSVRQPDQDRLVRPTITALAAALGNRLEPARSAGRLLGADTAAGLQFE
jgi:predicted ATPase/DNA-binding SARP family transcriptional activator